MGGRSVSDWGARVKRESEDECRMQNAEWRIEKGSAAIRRKSFSRGSAENAEMRIVFLRVSA
jgi:hypothetical protein